MEPILINPLFPSILRTWKFFTTFHDYLDLPQTFSNVSLYEFHQHIVQNKFATAFTAQLIEALVKSIKGSEKSKKPVITAFFLAKQNKFNFFEELTKISAYELGLSEVTLALAWRGLETIPQQKAFEILTEKDKFTYLSMLTDLVSTRESFKKTYMQTVKTEYASALENSEKSSTLEVQKKFIPKIHYSSVLGKDSEGNSYFYLSKIGDSILKCEPRTKIWKRIEGHERIKREILDKIIQKSDAIKNEEVDLLEQIYEVWKRIDWKIQYTAFDKHKKLFKINQEAPKVNKMKILREKFHEIDDEYTKFISNCFNSRWATKERRIAYHKEIDEAQTMQDLLGCFGNFFNATKCSTQRKINTLDFYDTSLETKDQKPEQFKSIFLHGNFLYLKGVYSETANSQKYPNGLFHQIKSVLQDPAKFQYLLFEYLFIFIQTMLCTLKDLYPGFYQKRLKRIQNLQEEKRKQQEQSKRNKTSKLTKESKKNSNDQNSSDESSDSQSETAEQKKQQRRPELGKRLRQKVKINYKITNSNSHSIKRKSNSHSIKRKSKPSRPVVQPIRKLPKRNAKGYKNSKMTLESDSQEDVDLSMSENESENSEQSGGVNLDNFKYVQTSPKVSVRRSLRTSSKSKEKK